MPETTEPDAPRALSLARVLGVQAHANRLANRRLQAALANLSTSELHSKRISFFPSLIGTLNHLLAVDRYYIAALHGEPDMEAQYRRFAPHDELAPYVSAQDASDQKLIAFCDKLDDAGVNAEVAMDRGEGKVQRDLAGYVLAHLFMHQTHHRGQVHAMLSGTHVKPPQLDEFIMPSDASYRVQDMSALGWSEREVFG
ncbi:DinB family protein [Scleromatobacter humisilvae]|uniref:DinB family protein n=1 Tax=Scleromatobacter humisilvae TaxID=2897159 RepID=A0A9X1YPS3_9BURK|nr:DinB family protein [Scleromatobacter humisilvae]MCK9689050.1 DinB family protein [Scleromatobacter humisilvae]